MPFILSNLTFVYTSFEKIFCQNKVKKNRNQSLWFSQRDADVRRWERHGKRGSWTRWNDIDNMCRRTYSAMLYVLLYGMLFLLLR